MIDPDLVHTTFLNSLFTDEEVAEGITHFTEAKGIMLHVGFHPQRLEEQRSQVVEWLSQLPDNFKDSLGGGWTFLHFHTLANGEQWTSFHKVCDELITLGIGLKLCSVLLREVSSELPGGVPYIIVHDLIEA